METLKNLADYLTIDETAEYLRVCQRTVFNYIKQGLLNPVRIGGQKKTGRVLLPKSEIINLLSKNQGH